MTLDDQKLKKVGARERYAISLASSTNQRMRQNFQAEQKRRHGRAACTWCGAEPCGVLWTKPGASEPGGDRCCSRCSHEPVEGWQHTHTAWDGMQTYPVCALVMREGETVFMRRDGVVQFLELRTPAPVPDELPEGAEPLEHDEHQKDVPSVSFLGSSGGVALYMAGEGGPEHTNLWEFKADLDVLWIPIRMQSAVARDLARRKKLGDFLEAQMAAHIAAEDARIAKEAEERAARIEKKSLQFETKLVLRELAEDEIALPDELADVSEEAEEMPAATEPAPTEPEAPKPKVNLKEPVPVKKGPGRPKRSARQRRARERQKRAWAVQEARQRLEVKRFQRTARNQPSGEAELRDKEEAE